MVTFSTIGFGDLTPNTEPSRVVVMILIVCVIIYVPMQTSRIIEIFNSTSTYQRARYSPSTQKGHVILAGSVSYTAIMDFCREYFAVDTSSKLIILTQKDPSLNTRKLMRHPFYRNKIIFINGSPYAIQDLHRAAAKYASSLFLLNVPSSETAVADSSQDDEQVKVTRGSDAEILMQSLITKKAFPGIPIFAQVQDLASEELSFNCGCDRVLCLDKIKMSILARDCLVPGFLALVLNLVSTYKESGKFKGQGGLEDAWMQEYDIGSSNEIISFRIPPGLVRTTWDECVESLYRAFNVTLFAVKSLSGPQTGKLRMNPNIEYKMRHDDVGYAISNGGDDVLLRISIQFKDPIPKEHLDLLELEAQIDSLINPLPVVISTSLDDLVSSPPKISKEEGQESFESIPQMKFLRDHIILCGHMTARGVKHFVHCIRSGEYIDDSGIHIVCLLENIPNPDLTSSDDIWAEILRDSNVSLIRGTPLKRSSLVNAGIAFCRRIVIFTTPIQNPSGSGDESEQSHILPDANSIFIIKMIQEVIIILSRFT
jgi:hypothetical protein